MTDTGDDEPARLVAGLRAELTSRRDQVRAAAVVVDVRLPEQGRDGVQVELEHREGAALQVVLPYSQAGGAVELGTLAASSGTVRIWS